MKKKIKLDIPTWTSRDSDVSEHVLWTSNWKKRSQLTLTDFSNRQKIVLFKWRVEEKIAPCQYSIPSPLFDPMDLCLNQRQSWSRASFPPQGMLRIRDTVRQWCSSKNTFGFDGRAYTHEDEALNSVFELVLIPNNRKPDK